MPGLRGWLDAVEVSVDVLGNGFDLRAQLLLDFVHVEAVLECDEVDGEAQVTEAAAATDAMQVCLSALGKVKVDDHVLRTINKHIARKRG